MAELAVAAAIGGTALQAVGAIQQGRAADVSAKFEAQQLEQNARQREAIAQREAIVRADAIRKAESSAIARAGAGGVAIQSPTIANILGGFEEDAAYERDVALYQGAEEATGMRTQADATRIAGRQARRAGVMSAITTTAMNAATFGAGKTLGDKYGFRGSTIFGSSGSSTIR